MDGMLRIKSGDVWTLPSGKLVFIVAGGLYDIELRYVDSLLGESFFVLRRWLLTHCHWHGVHAPKVDRQTVLGAHGFPTGEGHGRTKFTDEEVELVRSLHAAGLTYEQIVEKWDADKPISKSTVAWIVQGRHRVHTPAKGRK